MEDRIRSSTDVIDTWSRLVNIVVISFFNLLYQYICRYFIPIRILIWRLLVGILIKANLFRVSTHK